VEQIYQATYLPKFIVISWCSPVHVCYCYSEKAKRPIIYLLEHGAVTFTWLDFGRNRQRATGGAVCKSVMCCACLLQPATVSRCGMIYLEPSTLGWHPMLKSWVNTLPQSLQTDESSSVVFTMFDWLVDPCITFVKKSCKVREHSIITYNELKKKELYNVM